MRRIIANSDNAPLRRRVLALLSAAALVAALGVGAAFAGDEADDNNAVLPVSDIPAAQVDGEDESTASEADASEDVAEEEFPLPEDEGGASLKGAVAFTNVAPLVGFASTEVAEGGYDDGVAKHATAGIMSAATNLFAAFSGSDGAAASEGESFDDDDDGVVLDKTAKANSDGGFTITLEAYATGEQTTVSHYDPADIALVLDTSGSMTWAMDDSDDGSFTPVYFTSTNGYDTSVTYFVKENGKYVRASIIQKSTFGWCTNNGYAADPREYITPMQNANDSGTTTVKFNDKSYTYTKTQFYTLKDDQTRLFSLKTAVNSFISNVLETSSESSIAIVPFGDGVGTTTAFTSDGTTLTNAVNALTAAGATNSGAAMTTAASMINSLDDSHSGHKKVVVMFTDGEPTTGNSFDSTVANMAISQSKKLKDNSVTVYTVGVVDGANGALSSMGTSNLNTYMHSVSSNYPEAESMAKSGKKNEKLDGDSYYLTATNASELNKIFTKISQQVGGADNAKLDSSTVVKDIVSPQFTLPEGAVITLETWKCTGVDNSGEYTWTKNDDAMGATVTIGSTDGTNATITNNQVSVTGFDFADNWVGTVTTDDGTTYRGNKLVIEFTVEPQAGFLGGNNVPTNGAASGVYDKNGALIGSFPQPTVNVPIEEITITANDRNVYLTQVPTEYRLKSGVTVRCGGVDITDPSKLEEWQTAYVNVTGPDIAASEGFDATSDGTYTVTASVNPITTGDSSKPGTEATKQTESESKNINVFKPELTFKDSTVWYGGDAPESYESNLTQTRWVHYTTTAAEDGTETTTEEVAGSQGVTMVVGIAPTLALTYNPESGKIVDGKIATKQDIPVDVAVKIGDWDVANYVTFKHTDCTGKTCGKPENGKFWLHVNTCQLTVTKVADAANESYVFDVYKNGAKYTEVTICGNGSVIICELPVGTYTIEEDAGWSWRYSATYSAGVALSSANTSGAITCNNTSNTDKWLNGFSVVVKNIYGVANSN